METNKKNDTGEGKESEKSKENKEGKENKQNNSNQNTNQQSFGGFDFLKFLKNEDIMEILKHLLSGGGAMAGTYLTWIKPLQDKIETINKTISDQEKRIKELEAEQEKLIVELKDERSESDNNFNRTGNDFFNINGRNITGNNYSCKSRRVNF
jgi:hypothetical protein